MEQSAFDYKGIFCSMAAFKEHCIFGFWKHQLLIDRGVIEPGDAILGHRGRITSVDDLPPDKELTRILKAAAELNDKGIKAERRRLNRSRPSKCPRTSRRPWTETRRPPRRSPRSVQPQARIRRVDDRSQERRDAE
jgi:hypothetical protein